MCEAPHSRPWLECLCRMTREAAPCHWISLQVWCSTLKLELSSAKSECVMLKVMCYLTLLGTDAAQVDQILTSNLMQGSIFRHLFPVFHSPQPCSSACSLERTEAGVFKAYSTTDPRDGSSSWVLCESSHLQKKRRSWKLFWHYLFSWIV